MLSRYARELSNLQQYEAMGGVPGCAPALSACLACIRVHLGPLSSLVLRRRRTVQVCAGPGDRVGKLP